MLQTSSLLVLTATEAHPQYGDIVYYPSLNPAVPHAPLPSTHLYGVSPPADSAVVADRKKMKAAEIYQAHVEALALVALG